MKILHNNDPFFHISLENIFSEDRLKIIFKEINELKNNFENPESTGSSTYNFEVLKKNTGMFLVKSENYENLKTIKFIDNCIKKISITDNWKNTAFRRLFDSVIWGSELINCYKKNDYYKPHVDEGIFTLLFFLWERTSNFEGGDLFFPEYDYLHKCKNNHGILFFSKELHGVTPIISKEKISTRYSIATFSILNTNPTKNKKINHNSNKQTLLSYQ